MRAAILVRGIMVRSVPALRSYEIRPSVEGKSIDNNDEAQSRVDTGIAHTDSGEYGRAIEEFSEAIRLTADGAYECYVRRAYACVRMCEFDRADVDYSIGDKASTRTSTWPTP